MRVYPFYIILFFLMSCSNERILKLPEIQNAKITDVKDVSPAYIFYDETKPDSVELNRKNLIITTNWLVNVDTRLKLDQAIPSIIKLQDKKRNAKMHKNENAKNYFTCNDTAINNLGFIDFTEVIYQLNNYDPKIEGNDENKTIISVFFNENNALLIDGTKITKEAFIDQLHKMIEADSTINLQIIVNYSKNLTFQDYITNKSFISSLENESILVSNYEFIY